MSPLRITFLFLSSFILVASAFIFDNRSNNHGKQKIASAWYASWHKDDFPLSKVPWSKYTHLTYAFAESSPDVNTLSISDEAYLPEFVKTAKHHGVKPMVSLGGWTGSMYFSSAVSTPHNRTAFVKTVTNLATKYSLAGIDFDWEAPSNPGIGCNTNSPDDTANFILFLRELRKDKVGSKLLISMAAGLAPYPDENGEWADMSPFGELLDWLAIMNYDINGHWNDPPFVGANAPLKDACAPEDKQTGSITSGLGWWTDNGFPKEKIILGVPAYGHSYIAPKANAFKNTTKHTSELNLYATFDVEQYPVGDAWDDPPAVDACGILESQGGVWSFWGMIKAGWLTKDGKPSKNKDITYIFDKCSQTPFIYNSASEIMISYDDATSALAKGKFIKQNGLAGFAMWEAGGDYKDILLDAYKSGSGC
ncbi:endochitinase [Flagelloscypha sp. PMI_526]|nr:endochitinase [Flagelloscypha sp. PMI_526]